VNGESIGDSTNNFVGRLRQVQLPPRFASNNIGSKKNVVLYVERLQPRQAGCNCCAAHARVIRSKLVAPEAELGQGREINEGTAQVGRAWGLEVCVAEVEVGQRREVRDRREQ
jgi:hypothetical protein